MRIVFTGGGTGGHFYPVIAIAEAIVELSREQHILAPDLYYLAPTPFDEKALFDNGIEYRRVPAGKLRRYAAIQNITDLLKTGWGTCVALYKLFVIYPDVVVSKGGYVSVPVVTAARFLRIPIIIHESDAKPGRANLYAARFATKIAISFASAAKQFPPAVQKKIARTGSPIRRALLRTDVEGADAFLHLDRSAPTVFIVGGSLGSKRINEAVLEALPGLVETANIIHQTGKANYDAVVAIAKVELEKSQYAQRYHPVNYLSELAMQQAASAASLIISRAGAGSIAEIGAWRKPAILIPIPESVSHDQRTNAYAYAQSGAAEVLEEENLTPHVLLSEVQRILQDQNARDRMITAAATSTDTDAARILAHEALSIALSHEA